MRKIVSLFFILFLITSPAYGYWTFNKHRGIYYCPKCENYYYDRNVSVSCCVLHPEGDCCHYQDIPIPKGKYDEFIEDLKGER